MRTTLELDEELLREAMRLLGTKTKRETVRRALEAVVAQRRKERLQAKLGRLDLDLTLADLKRMREDAGAGVRAD